MRGLRLCLTVVVVGLGSGTARHVAAQDVEQASVADEGGPFSAELRFRLFTTAYRWSSYSSNAVDLPDAGRRSLHVVPSFGARFYTKHDHGVLVDVDYRFDIDVDSDSGFLCIFSCPPTLWTEFVVVHVGYAYRYVIPSRSTGRITWTVSPHASLAAGSAYSAGNGAVGVSARSPVVGARFGVDVDLHIKRFFMGWSLQYEILKHTKGPLRLSHFLAWNVVPVFAMGAVLGRRVQASGHR